DEGAAGGAEVVPRSLVLGTAGPWGRGVSSSSSDEGAAGSSGPCYTSAQRRSREAEAEVGRYLKADEHVKEWQLQMPAHRADECYLMILLAYPPPRQGHILDPHPANPEIMWNASIEVIRSCWLKVSVATMRKHVSATDCVPFANAVNAFCAVKNIMANITPVEPFTSRVMAVVTALTEEAMENRGVEQPDFVTMGKGPRLCAEGWKVSHGLLHPQNAMRGTPLPNWHPDQAEQNCLDEDAKLTAMAIAFRTRVFGDAADTTPVTMYHRKYKREPPSAESRAIWLAGCSKGGKWSPHAVLAALTALRADGLPVSVEDEAEGERAEAALRGNIKGGKWSPHEVLAALAALRAAGLPVSVEEEAEGGQAEAALRGNIKGGKWSPHE
ncbi:hypothetical protein B484DRAFT_410968, partial [Ochromonadaceae sp. CCMP2298]